MTFSHWCKKTNIYLPQIGHWPINDRILSDPAWWVSGFVVITYRRTGDSTEAPTPGRSLDNLLAPVPLRVPICLLDGSQKSAWRESPLWAVKRCRVSFIQLRERRSLEISDGLRVLVHRGMFTGQILWILPVLIHSLIWISNDYVQPEETATPQRMGPLDQWSSAWRWGSKTFPQGSPAFYISGIYIMIRNYSKIRVMKSQKK